MSLTKHLKRWIKASYIEEIRKLIEQGFPLFVEGDDIDPKLHKRIELRIDGPYLSSCGTRGEMRAFIEVNLLGNCTRDESNAYARENMQSLMAFILNRDFCIYKIGNVGKIQEDDESLLGVMRLLPTELIKVSDFGMINNDTEVYQATTEAHYEMFYRE